MRGERVDHLARRLLRPFGIPALTPLGLALFRVALGLGLLYILLVYQPIEPYGVEIRRPHSPLANAGWIFALSVDRTTTAILQRVALTATTLFILGIVARPAYVVVVVLMFVNVLIILARTGAHDWGLPIVTLLLLAVVPWSRAPNLFELMRSWRTYAAPRLADRENGFAIWLPGLTLGLAFAAAAYAKVIGTGIRWITNGSVRYHFVEDGRNAPITLGLWIATHQGLAIALSLAAVVVEATFILVVFARGWRTRLIFGLMGGSLMAGFTLFQGVAWWPWRILFLAFLPWTLFTSMGNRRTAGDVTSAAAVAPGDLRWFHAAIVVVLVGTQMWASYRVVEIEPLISNFPMYAYTFASPEAFDRAQTRTRFESKGTDISDRIEASAGENFLRRMVATPSGKEHDPEREAETEELRTEFAERYTRMYGPLPPSIDVVRVRRPFDWQNGKYLPQARERIGTVQLH